MNTSSSNMDINSASAGYSTLGTQPLVATRVLNSQTPSYKPFQNAWDAGLLNPAQNMVGGRYNTITTAYSNVCTPTSNYYTMSK